MEIAADRAPTKTAPLRGAPSLSAPPSFPNGIPQGHGRTHHPEVVAEFLCRSGSVDDNSRVLHFEQTLRARSSSIDTLLNYRCLRSPGKSAPGFSFEGSVFKLRVALSSGPARGQVRTARAGPDHSPQNYAFPDALPQAVICKLARFALKLLIFKEKTARTAFANIVMWSKAA